MCYTRNPLVFFDGRLGRIGFIARLISRVSIDIFIIRELYALFVRAFYVHDDTREIFKARAREI